MNLRYRGVSYRHLSSSLETTETETMARFRGTTYKVRCPIYQPNQKKLNLKYRGIALNTVNPALQQPQASEKTPFITKLITQLD
jgi:hypothetical protein